MSQYWIIDGLVRKLTYKLACFLKKMILKQKLSLHLILVLKNLDQAGFRNGLKYAVTIKFWVKGHIWPKGTF